MSKQISQLGFFLKKALEKLLKQNNETDLIQSVLEINQKLQEELGFDLTILETISEDMLIVFLEQHPQFSEENLETLADILSVFKSENFNRKALLIYNHINAKTATFSFERNAKIESLKLKL
ncbi:hypothetical protein LZZ90_06790 [Flavobacterium sp. SM15]|uniref:hypothetical protein n=1 Tax=Flavobacterium sp. SM15 TaxID=2908005 RepID=UPI001EDAD3B4|nr:hypothetical protein [Flavobacterium sp. SM15]MCG2611209.1 hypothetical protein [Flavobacterium sp. SM15]